MMTWLKKNAESNSIDSEIASIVDWIILGRYTGYRRSEWCQTTQTEYTRIMEWPGQPSEATILEDLEFLDSDEQLIKLTSTTDLNLIEYVKVTWRKQKNGQNGEEIPFARDRKEPKVCPVLAAIRIVQRANRLGVPLGEPIAVFKNKKGQRRFITDKMVAALLRKAASEVLNIDKHSAKLTLWSTHSIRVTAANLLHREKMTDTFIQTRLRWRSNSFLMYLRNTFYSADQHTKVLRVSDNNLPPKHLRAYREIEPHESITEAFAAAA